MDKHPHKTMMRSLGEFVGHIVHAVRRDPAPQRTVLNRTVEEEHRGNVTLRRTTVEEIEVGPQPRR